MNIYKSRLLACTFLIINFISAAAQDIFSYEKEIANKENYTFEDIAFTIPDKKGTVTFTGTLIQPKTGFDKIVIIVPGSGRDTRNSHYKLTEAFLKNNIAVYRYDDRGTGKSGGTFSDANYTVSTMANELLSAFKAIKALPVLAQKKIGFLGHSQGGLVTMGAVKNGAVPDFLIQWAAPAQKHGAFIMYQVVSGQNTFNDYFKGMGQDKKLEIMAAVHKVVEENPTDDDWQLYKKIEKANKRSGYTRRDYERFPYLTLSSEKDIVRQNFEPLYKSTTIPLLYIIGSNDTFADPVAETQLLKTLGNKNTTIKIAQGLNHYLTGGILIQQTMYEIDGTAAADIVNWIMALK